MKARHLFLSLLVFFAVVPLSHAATNEEAFTGSFLAKIAAAVPTHHFEYSGSLEITDTNTGGHLYLDRIFRYVSANPTETDAATANYVSRYAQLITEADQPIRKEQLRLAVRNAATLKSTLQSMGAGPHVAYPHDLVGDLVVVPVIDMPTRVKYVGEKDLATLGLTEQQAEEIGAKNLQRTQQPLIQVAKIPPASGIGIVDEEYAASRLIFVSEWLPIQKQIGGNLVVMAPAYDKVIYGDGSTPIAVDALRTIGLQIAKQSQTPLSPTVFRFAGDHWEVVK